MQKFYSSYGFVCFGNNRTVENSNIYLASAILRSKTMLNKDMAVQLGKSVRTIDRIVNQDTESSKSTVNFKLLELILKTYDVDYLHFQKSVYKLLNSKYSAYYDSFEKSFKFISLRKARRLFFSYGKNRRLINRYLVNRRLKVPVYSDAFFIRKFQKLPKEVFKFSERSKYMRTKT